MNNSNLKSYLALFPRYRILLVKSSMSIGVHIFNAFISVNL